ncbi:hypothetical protein PLESTB_000832400 [Pleodorina starrii]|uniref:EGF-like domain-containing protein n=1 Tax=Pleodorina starrii TaxID=330485 RepID=A0A9W6BL40_9CHLO|nr:hypothetical protein PLESTM_000148300 [Pleodorina starrii]GLC54182.1 hypothetical protein PLESTB_000832400 [Pleodorina starrii]GLC64518.1 hypothetical protein PLESTF_000174600 [Pleodorina starrii]
MVSPSVLVTFRVAVLLVCVQRLTSQFAGIGGLRGLLNEWELPTKVHYDLPPKKYLQATTGSTAHTTKSRSEHQENSLDSAVRRRCRLVRGTWCGDFLRQEAVPTRAVPRGDKDCPNGCSGWGNCNHDTGLCDCPAGRGGPDCGQEVKRPCASGHRDKRFPNNTQPVSSIGPDKLDLNVTAEGWTASRCFGYCYDDLAACFCGEGAFRHIPAPAGSPPWTPPLQWGRPLSDGCQPNKDAVGNPSFCHGSGTTYDEIYGPEGWCNKKDSGKQCGCLMEIAEPCDFSQPMETSCVNQCGGHGECFFGFCRCHPGWYGADCSRKRAGLDMEPGLHETGSRPWLTRLVATPPAALPQPPAPTRPRPLIYVYDIPAEYTSRMLQYRVAANTCIYRRFVERNHTGFTGFTYSIEMLLHERLLQSEHRTFDPEEADFFYVPVYVACYFWPVLGWADFPWWYAPYGMRPMHGANMLMEVQGWLSSVLPYWSRRGGRDHVWLMPHDEGACWMPRDLYDRSIVLTHWGRMDLDHKSNSAYMQDVYTNVVDAGYMVWPGTDFQQRIKGHPCYDPRKDLVIPAFKQPDHYSASPLLGGPPLERDILLYFRGDVGLHRKKEYSRGVRQRLFKLAAEGDWFPRYRIAIGAGHMIPGSYSEHLARSKFCLVAPGDGWSARAEDAVLHGCVPLVIMDNVHAVFESILDWDSFSIRIREDDAALAALPELLTAVPPERLAKMQRNLARVWHRFTYASGPYLEAAVERAFEGNAKTLGNVSLGPVPPDSPFQRATSFPTRDDAFHTILQWLYHRIPDTRGP